MQLVVRVLLKQINSVLRGQAYDIMELVPR